MTRTVRGITFISSHWNTSVITSAISASGARSQIPLQFVGARHLNENPANDWVRLFHRVLYRRRKVSLSDLPVL